jgi:hypothetical protein
MVTEYFVCSAFSVTDLNKVVNEAIKNGWQPLGAIAACVRWFSGGNHFVEHEKLYQVVVRIKEDERKPAT